MAKRDQKLNYLNKLIFEKNIIAMVKFSVVTTIYIYILFANIYTEIWKKCSYCKFTLSTLPKKVLFSILLFLVFGLNRCTIADKCFCSVQIRGNTEQEKSLFVSFIHNMKEH